MIAPSALASFFDFVVQSGRAVIYPVYQNTYERRLRGALPGAAQQKGLFVQRSEDVQRAVDYLQAGRTSRKTTSRTWV